MSVDLVIKLAAYVVIVTMAFVALRYQVIAAVKMVKETKDWVTSTIGELKTQIHDLTLSVKEVAKLASSAHAHEDKVNWRLTVVEEETDKLRKANHDLRADISGRLIRLEVVVEQIMRQERLRTDVEGS